VVEVRMTWEEYLGILRADHTGILEAAREAVPIPEAKPKGRKVGKYQREYGRQYRKLKAKHPRMTHNSLTKKAHRETKRALK